MYCLLTYHISETNKSRVKVNKLCREQWRNNRACSARGPSAAGAQNLPDAVFKKFFWGKRGAFWNTCTRAHCNLVTPLVENPQLN